MQLHFSGGEPVLRDDLSELIRHARAQDLYTNLITGGTLLEVDKLRRFREAGLDHIQLSIQGAARESAEAIAGVRSHRKKLDVARLIGKIGFPLTLNVVIHRMNIAELPELIGLALELGANRLELANTQFYARAAIAKYRGTLEIAFVQNDYLSGEPKPCMGGWGRSYMCINPTGQVMPCHAAAVIPGLRFESVKDLPLGRMWRDSPAIIAFRGDGWMLQPCRECPRKTIDFGGCRCQAFLLTGNAAQADPICRLSPHHAAIEAARTGRAGDASPVYRDVRNSRSNT